MSDFREHRILLEKLIDVADRIDILKIGRKKQFTLPYRTIFDILSEYNNNNNNDKYDVKEETELFQKIDTVLKRKNDEEIQNVKNQFISFIRKPETKKRLVCALKKSIENYDDRLCKTLQFFKSSCSNLVNQKKRTNVGVDKHSIVSSNFNDIEQQLPTSTIYKQLIKTSPMDTMTTMQTNIVVKITLKSTDWSQLSANVNNSQSLLLMCSSIFYSQNGVPNLRNGTLKTDNDEPLSIAKAINSVRYKRNVDTLDLKGYLDLTGEQVIILKLYLFVSTQSNNCYILNDEQIVKVLIERLCLKEIVDGGGGGGGGNRTEVISLKSLVCRHYHKISKLDDQTKTRMFPLLLNDWSLENLNRILRYNDFIKKSMKIIGQTSFNELFPGDLMYFHMTTFYLNNLSECSFLKQLSNVQISVAKRYFGNECGYREFIPNQMYLLTILNFKSLDDNLYRYISKVYHIKIIVINERGQIRDVTDANIHSEYHLFLYESEHKINILKFQDRILIQCKNWSEWITTNDKGNKASWMPTLSEIWNYFKNTLQHVPPIKELSDKKGIQVFKIPFLTKNYKTFINTVPDDHNQKETLSLQCHGIYYMQYEDAFNFVKRQSSKKHELHQKDQYENISVRELLKYIPLDAIHKIIVTNNDHGIFSDNVSPIFQTFGQFDNITMLKWYIVSNRFKSRIKGYFSSGKPIYFEKVFDTTIDPISDTCVGYQWDKLKVFNKANIFAHKLTYEQVVLVIASMYSDEYFIDTMKNNVLDCDIPIEKSFFKDRMVFSGFFSSRYLKSIEKHKQYTVQKDVICKFLVYYFERYGPFAVFGHEKSSELTQYLFDMQLYYNSIGCVLDEDMHLCFYNISELLLHQDIFVSIPENDWKKYTRNIPNTQKYEQTRDIPSVPCYCKIKGNDKMYIVQSYDVSSGMWKILVDGTIISVSNDAFTIVKDERVLPAKCLINTNELIRDIPNLEKYGGVLTEGTVVKNFDNTSYLVNVEHLHTPIKMVKHKHFQWKDPPVLQLEDVKKTEQGNVDNELKLEEDRAYDKGFSNRNAKTKTKMYNPIRKDAHLPSTDEVALPEWINEDENLGKLLNEESSESIFPFIGFTQVEVSVDELYGIYGKIMDRYALELESLTYEKILKLVIDDLWNDMITDRVCFNVASVLNKVESNVIDLKESIINEVYGDYGKELL